MSQSEYWAAHFLTVCTQNSFLYIGIMTPSRVWALRRALALLLLLFFFFFRKVLSGFLKQASRKILWNVKQITAVSALLDATAVPPPLQRDPLWPAWLSLNTACSHSESRKTSFPSSWMLSRLYHHFAILLRVLVSWCFFFFFQWTRHVLSQAKYGSNLSTTPNMVLDNNTRIAGYLQDTQMPRVWGFIRMKMDRRWWLMKRERGKLSSIT